MTETSIEAKKRYREQIRQARGPNRGLTLLDRHNNLYPDELHQHWLDAHGYEVLEDGSLQEKTKEKTKRRGRGRLPGEIYRCPNCGEPGHYRKTCPKR